MTQDLAPPPASDAVQRLLDADPYPRCSEQEMRARRALVEAVGAESGVDAILVRGAQKRTPTIFWLTGWPVTNEAIVTVALGERMAMVVANRNHAPFASEMAGECDVTWAHGGLMDDVAAGLGARRRVGMIGLLTHAHHEALTSRGIEVVSLNRAFERARIVKSAEEIEWLRAGAYLSDLGVLALREASVPGRPASSWQMRSSARTSASAATRTSTSSA